MTLSLLPSFETKVIIPKSIAYSSLFNKLPLTYTYSCISDWLKFNGKLNLLVGSSARYVILYETGDKSVESQATGAL